MSGALLSQCANAILRSSFGWNNTCSGSRLIFVRWKNTLTLTAPSSSPYQKNLLQFNKDLTVPRPTINFNVFQFAFPNVNGAGKFISTSCILYAEPLKKKKKMDPAVIKHREERRKKKLEKAIRKLERASRQYKPLDESETPIQLLEEPKQRTRRLPVISTEEANARWRLQKEWSRYKRNEHISNTIQFERILKSQQNALAQLRLESEDLYFAACEVDEALLPYQATGPVNTPPIENYQSPNGDYNDISKKWV